MHLPTRTLLAAVLLAPLACAQFGGPFGPNPPSMTLSQPGGPGTLEIRNDNLIVNAEYFNFFTVNEPPLGGFNTGPYLGLWTNDLNGLLLQAFSPLGLWPFHFVPPPPSMGTTQWPIFGGVPGGLHIESVSVRFNSTTGLIEAWSAPGVVNTL